MSFRGLRGLAAATSLRWDYDESVSIGESEFDIRESPCSRCGGDARFRYLDDSKQNVEIECPACGRFVMPREAFDYAAADVAETEFE